MTGNRVREPIRRLKPLASSTRLNDDQDRGKLSLLCCRRQIPSHDRSLKRIDLRELRPHRFPQRPGIQVSLPPMFEGRQLGLSQRSSATARLVKTKRGERDLAKQECTSNAGP